MAFRVEFTRRAENDIATIVDWIAGRSREGAMTWSLRLDEVIGGLETSAASCGLAPENGYCDTELRDLVFKTRRGKRYRLLFSIRDDVVFVRHVRGPGQDLVSPDDL